MRRRRGRRWRAGLQVLWPEYLRSLIEATEQHSMEHMLLGIILWAPFDESCEVFEEWLSLAEEAAGPRMWERVKEFRFLLQAMTDPATFEQVVCGADFARNLQSLSPRERHFVFDVGIDQLNPWIDVVFDLFGPDRIMFGSDWPVCNVRGPAGEQSWSIWMSTVQEMLDQRRLNTARQRRVWSDTAIEVYRLNVPSQTSQRLA